MKINKKRLELIESGLSSKTVTKLTESQIDVLHSKLIKEQVVQKQTTKFEIGPQGGTLPSSPKGYSVKVDPVTKKAIAVATESELDEEEEVTIDPNKDTETQDAHQVGPSSDDGFGNEDDGMGMFEGKKQKPNPWAICHAQVGPKKTRKFERCVQSVKKQLSEGKNPVTLFLESQIMNIVEKHIPPRITKGDLLNYLSEDKNFATKHIQSFGESSDTETAPVKPKTKPSTKPKKPGHPGKNPNPKENPAPKAKTNVEEAGPATAPTKPKPSTKPGTKPGTKPQKPAHPGKNPNPNENPAPKAKTPSAEQTKDKVIDVILNILKK